MQSMDNLLLSVISLYLYLGNEFVAGEYQYSEYLVTNYASHHRHSCIGARAGFGDLLIGAGVILPRQWFKSRGCKSYKRLHGRVDYDR